MQESERALEVLEALEDEYSRKILVTAISAPSSIEEIAHKQNIPLSSCYRMAHILEDKKMLKKTETIISDDGKKYWRYKSLLKSVKFEFLDSDFHIEIEQNEFPDNDDREPRSTRSVNIYPGELMLKK